jgi:hypothetical protein
VRQALGDLNAQILAVASITCHATLLVVFVQMEDVLKDIVATVVPMT